MGQFKAMNRLIQRTIVGNPPKLILQFETLQRYEKKLPPKNDADAIRLVRDQAVAWAHSVYPITIGQEYSIKKALTEAGYFVGKFTRLARIKEAIAISNCMSEEEKVDLLNRLEEIHREK